MGDFHYTYPNGRQYNPSTYVLPEHQLDVDRSNLKHHMAGLLFDGKLHFAPIGSHPQKILDLGTGSGKWAMDAGQWGNSVSLITICIQVLCYLHPTLESTHITPVDWNTRVEEVQASSGLWPACISASCKLASWVLATVKVVGASFHGAAVVRSKLPDDDMSHADRPLTVIVSYVPVQKNIIPMVW